MFKRLGGNLSSVPLPGPCPSVVAGGPTDCGSPVTNQNVESVSKITDKTNKMPLIYFGLAVLGLIVVLK